VQFEKGPLPAAHVNHRKPVGQAAREIIERLREYPAFFQHLHIPDPSIKR
jgi:hypothetical protein